MVGRAVATAENGPSSVFTHAAVVRSLLLVREVMPLEADDGWWTLDGGTLPRQIGGYQPLLYSHDELLLREFDGGTLFVYDVCVHCGHVQQKVE